MSESQGQPATPNRRAVQGAIRGVIRRRLLVNVVVDPDEAAARLPVGLRPHRTDLGTVVGCCLLDIRHVRPAFLPAAAGVTLRAAAHRLSVEWEDESGHTIVGVYVPMRQTDSRLASMVGGRLFPGVHRRTGIAIDDRPDRLSWRVSTGDEQDEGRIQVTATVTVGRDTEDDHLVGATCTAAAFGVSPDRHGVLEAARMAPDHRWTARVEVAELRSAFLDGFVTAQTAPAYLMQDVGVTWTTAQAPALAPVLVA